MYNHISVVILLHESVHVYDGSFGGARLLSMYDLLKIFPQLWPRREAWRGGARHGRDYEMPLWLRDAVQAQDDRHIPRSLTETQRIGLDRL